MQIKVVEIFDSIEGEGKRSGLPATFIRLAGCNLRCSYCDTEYAQSGDEYELMTVDSILERSVRKRITLTGGEPLIHEGAAELVSKLLQSSHEVNIETNGAVDICEFLSKINANYREENLFFTVDYKLPSSGCNDKMIFENYTRLKPWDVIKFVVGSDADTACMVEFIERIKPCHTIMPHIFIGAVYSEYDPKKLVQTILNTPALSDARLGVQLHKIVWDADTRGV